MASSGGGLSDSIFLVLYKIISRVLFFRERKYDHLSASMRCRRTLAAGETGLKEQSLFRFLHPALHRIGFATSPSRDGMVHLVGLFTFGVPEPPFERQFQHTLIVSVALSVTDPFRSGPVPVRNYLVPLVLGLSSAWPLKTFVLRRQKPDFNAHVFLNTLRLKFGFFLVIQRFWKVIHFNVRRRSFTCRAGLF